MNVATRHREGVLIVDVSGDVDLKWSPVLRKELFLALKEAPKVALNLAAIRYIDSSGIAVMIEGLKEAQRLQRDFVLFGMSPAVHDVFKLTHVIRIFHVVENEDEAVAA